jgi:hypothetical protein
MAIPASLLYLSQSTGSPLSHQASSFFWVYGYALAKSPVRPAVVGSTLRKLSRITAMIVMLMIGRGTFPAIRIRRTLSIVHLSPDLGSEVHACMIPGPVTYMVGSCSL